jgi:hypothetical protein
MKIVALYSDEWFGQMIENVLNGLPEGTSSDARANATAMLHSAAFIAQSIENAIGGTPEEKDNGFMESTVVGAIKLAAQEVAGLAAAMREETRAANSRGESRYEDTGEDCG